jgi:nucleotide-binding universal stress UspA family protein
VIEKTIVGWDASPQAEAALEWATKRVAPRGGIVSIVFAVPSTKTGADRQRTLEAQAALRDASARTRRAAPGCMVTTVVARGVPEDALLEYANRDWLLVVGATTHGGDRRRQRRSLGACLAAAAHGPVAIIPGRSAATGTGVVVGYDGSAEADAAAEFAARDARTAEDAVLTLVHAWNEPVLMEGQPLLDAQFMDALRHESRRLLETARDELVHRYPGLDVRTRSVHGLPASALASASRDASELVIGSRGLRGVRRLLLGSVSRDVVSRASCPTIVIGTEPPPLYVPDREHVSRALAESN